MESNADNDSQEDDSDRSEVVHINRIITIYLKMLLVDFDLSVRTENCLRLANFVYVGDLVIKSLQDLSRVPNFGRSALKEVNSLLADLNLSLGMEIPGWPPENIDEFCLETEDVNALVENVDDENPFYIIDDNLKRVLATPLSIIPFSVRTSIGLNTLGLKTLGDLVIKNLQDLLRIPNFERRSLKEVNILLADFNLSLGMEIPGWPPENIDEFYLETENSDTLDESVADTNPSNKTFDRDFQRVLETPLSIIPFSVRSTNVMETLGLKTLGDLAKQTRYDLMTTNNFGRTSLHEVEEILSQYDLKLGMVLQEWTDEEITEVDDLPFFVPLSDEEHKTLEDELLAAVEMAVPKRSWRIIYARSGWKGKKISTLQELGIDPELSGLGHSVSRERIRQLESGAIRKLRKRQFSTPVLDRALKLVEKATPLLAENVSNILKSADLSKLELGRYALGFAAMTFDKKWDVEPTIIGGVTYLVSSDTDEWLYELLPVIIERATYTDFLSIIEFEDELSLESEDCLLKIRQTIDLHPNLEWLDEVDGIFWSKNRASGEHCKILNICRKIFSFTHEISLKMLHTALQRARTVELIPPSDLLERMLVCSEEFTVEGSLVRGAKGVQFNHLNGTDRALLSACKELGKTIRFLVLRDFLVRTGMSSNRANVAIITSPIIENVSRGIYTFIADPTKIDLSQDLHMEDRNWDNANDTNHVAIQFEVTPRHLTMGSHLLGDESLELRDWNVFDDDGVELGIISLMGRRLSGLADVFGAVSINSGATVILTFSNVDGRATLTIIQ